MLPSIAVLAMVEPESDEKIVPPATATRERRPGTRAMSRSTASIACPATPRVEHDLAHQDEEGDREEGEALGRVDRVADELLEADGAAHEDERPRNVDREEGEHDREPQHHEDDGGRR